MSTIAFFILALISIVSAIGVVFSKNPVYSVLALIVCFFSITGHYVLLNAHFLAVVNLIVYAGAIMVLFLFVIMLLNLNKESEPHKPFLAKLTAVISGSVLMVILAAALRTYEAGVPAELPETYGGAKDIGKIIFSEFLLPFEVSSILFITAMVGAVILGKKHVND